MTVWQCVTVWQCDSECVCCCTEAFHESVITFHCITIIAGQGFTFWWYLRWSQHKITISREWGIIKTLYTLNKLQPQPSKSYNIIKLTKYIIKKCLPFLILSSNDNLYQKFDLSVKHCLRWRKIWLIVFQDRMMDVYCTAPSGVASYLPSNIETKVVNWRPTLNWSDFYSGFFLSFTSDPVNTCKIEAVLGNSVIAIYYKEVM